MLDTHEPFQGHVDDEVAGKVAAGLTLIGSRDANGSNFKQTDVFGAKFNGYLPSGTYSVPVPETTFTAVCTLTVTGKIEKITPGSASVLARTCGWPAITVNRYGKGTGFFYTFDLASAGVSQGAALLARAIASTSPRGTDLAAGGVVPVRIRLQNRGGQAQVAVDETISAGQIVACLGGTASQTSAHWEASLAGGETRDFFYLLRLPQTSKAAVTLTTNVSYQAQGVWTPCKTQAMTLQVP
jgi:hypothetical protein